MTQLQNNQYRIFILQLILKLTIDVSIINKSNMNNQNLIKGSQAISNKANSRKAHMNRIRSSLQSVPMFSQNIKIASQKMSSRQTQESQSASRYNSSPSSKFAENSVGDYELFQEKYEILNKLGEGANGVVRKCKKRQNGQFFAVKAFRFEEQHLPGLKANFLFMKRLNHPNIIKYQALYIDLKKRMCWLVMELINFPSLQKVQFKNEDEMKKVMFQVMEALSYLHKLDIVHRDIKPQNILYDPQTQSVKLIDFGISKRFRRRGSFIDIWTITGTLYYRAPEMFSGGYRESIDVWAAGALLYKIVTGHTPFESEYHHQTIQNIREAQFQFPMVFNKYSNDLKNLIAKMLKKDPEERLTVNGCLTEVWFSKLYTESKKGKNLLNEQTFQPNTKNKMKMSAMLSMRAKQDESPSADILKNEPLELVRPYVRKVGGKEFHCIDSQWIRY